jgi:hypothetical protein
MGTELKTAPGAINSIAGQKLNSRQAGSLRLLQPSVSHQLLQARFLSGIQPNNRRLARKRDNPKPAASRFFQKT